MTMNDLQVPTPPLTFWEGLRYSHDPRLVWFHVRQVRAAEHMVAALAGVPRQAVRRALREIAHDVPFLSTFLSLHRTLAGREPRGHQFMFLSYQGGSPYFHQLVQYALVRLMQPEVVVETGGTPGNSSAFILRAMERNGRGILHTIDLPPTGTLDATRGHGGWIHEGLPTGQGSGWAVPEYLRLRHRQHLGDAKDLLPQVLALVPQVDLFIHDSDHSYAHMMWEFTTAWPYVRPGGVVMSDDVDASAAWGEFTAQQQLTTYRAGHLGAAAKPIVGG